MLLGELCIVEAELRIDPNQFSSQISDPMRREERTTAFSSYSNFMSTSDIAEWVMLLGELCIVQAELLIDPNVFSSYISDPMRQEEHATAFRLNF